jgi:hypothetical protein
MAELITIIQRAGFDSYKDLLRWTKKQLNTRVIKDEKEAVYKSEIVSLYTRHFHLEKKKAVDLYDALLGMGLLKEHYGSWTVDYLCTTFNI